MPEYEPAERFPVKFYLVAMAFIVLDVEIVFLYPFTTVFREPRRRTASIAMGVFLLVLLVPFAYLLSTGALEWGPVQAGRRSRAGTACCARPACPGATASTRRRRAGRRPTRRPRRWASSRSRTTSSPAGSRTS